LTEYLKSKKVDVFGTQCTLRIITECDVYVVVPLVYLVTLVAVLCVLRNSASLPSFYRLAVD